MPLPFEVELNANAFLVTLTGKWVLESFATSSFASSPVGIALVIASFPSPISIYLRFLFSSNPAHSLCAGDVIRDGGVGRRASSPGSLSKSYPEAHVHGGLAFAWLSVRFNGYLPPEAYSPLSRVKHQNATGVRGVARAGYFTIRVSSNHLLRLD